MHGGLRLGCSWFVWRDQLGLQKALVAVGCDGGLGLGYSWFMWMNQLSCCDGGLRLGCSWFMWRDQLGLQKGLTRYASIGIKINNTCLGY